MKQVFKKMCYELCRGYRTAFGYNGKTVSRRLFPSVNKEAIFVFGNQKSGTTVIAALLSDFGGLSSTLDIPTITIEEQELLHLRQLAFDDFLSKHKYEFSSDLIKEPCLTFLYKDLRKTFPFSKTVFIIRDPRDNIRSILNRLNVRGDLDIVENFNDLHIAWQRVVDNRWMGLKYTHYIDSLAARWNYAAGIYMDYSNEIILVRYEDFLVNKAKFIENLAQQLDIPQANDISQKVDVQYQPKGNHNISWIDFFGEENLTRIEKICVERMTLFDYNTKFLQLHPR